ncbi:MAG TPA: hypothetical protein VMF66_07670 [Candidatus Acidoferrum sp.]|nr:hypothetical protein [Candidatus Acidoferrum sp.]
MLTCTSTGIVRARYAALVAAALALLAVFGCGGGITYNATPQITGLVPPEVTADSQAFTLFVSGSQFISTTTVEWNGAEIPTVYDTASGQLLASVSAADVQTAGVAQVTVTSPAPGGGRSLAVAFTIDPGQNNGPAITSLSPTSAPLNAGALTLTVNGTNFVQGDYVTWNSGTRTTTFVSSTQLTADILATDLTVQQVASVAVHTSQVSVASPSVGFQVGSSTSGNVKFPQLVSKAENNAVADGESSSPAISDDGRYVAFYSNAKNLVSGGTTGNVFLRDTCAGQPASCLPGTVAVDVALNGAGPNGAAANHVAISADGRYVAFASNATNLTSVTLPAGEQRIFVRDMCVGATAPAPCAPHTELASLDGEGMIVAGAQPGISADGRFVAFNADLLKGSSSLAAISTDGRVFRSVKNVKSFVQSAVMVRDTCHGAVATCSPQTLIASAGRNVSLDAAPAISSSGRYVAFVSAANTTTPSQAYLLDTCFGTDFECAPSTVLVSAARDGHIGNRSSGSLAISGDGRFVAFESTASNLADGSVSGEQIYLRDTCVGPTAPLGCTPSTTQISGIAVISGIATGNYSPSISPSGRYVSYVASEQDGKTAPNAATTGDIVVYDTCFGATSACSPHASELIAADPSGNQSPLTSDIRIAVPVTDAGFAAFFTQQTVPAVRASGLGDVFLTTTPFRQ